MDVDVEQVAKSNRLIQGQFGWSLTEHRIATMLIAQIDRGDKDFELQTLKISDFLKQTGIQGRRIYDEAEEICKNLLDSRIDIRTFTEEDGRHYKGINPFDTCEYVEGKGEIRARFTKSMRPLLLRLKKRFTTYQLHNYARLSSRYSIRIFEYLKMREDLRSVTWTVDHLRDVLGCQNKYSRFSDFKRRVLETARKDIKETCEIYFTYHVERDGQIPVSITFTIKSKDREGLIEHADQLPGDEDLSVTSEEQGGPPLENYDIESMVREDLSQPQLDKLPVSKLREAVSEGIAEAEKRFPNDPAGTLAFRAHRFARKKALAMIE